MPLHIFIQGTGLSSFIRLTPQIENQNSYFNSKLCKIKGHIFRWQKIQKSAGLTDLRSDYLNDTLREKLFSVNLESFGGDKKHLRHTECNIYTDGSKLDYQCGAGYAIYKGRKIVAKGSVKLPGIISKE